MKRLTVDVTYRVPSWNFCNIDAGVRYTGKAPKELCRFCIKDGKGHRCALHNECLSSDGTFVEKTEGCCVATAGHAIEILDTAPPTVDPKELIKMSIDEYEKQLNNLISQGYPYAMARTIARQYMLGG